MGKKSINKRINDIYKKEGLEGIFLRIKLHIMRKGLPVEILPDIELYNDKKIFPLNCDEKKEHEKTNIKLINWIIPEMSAGSGGHNTMFRIASYLEKNGYHSNFYSVKKINFFEDTKFDDFAHTKFPILHKNIKFFCGTEHITYCDFVVATSAITAYYVKRFNNTRAKVYFVQDFEPMFEPIGTAYFLAENTYKMKFFGVTAGQWLEKKLYEEYDMWTRSFEFSYDKELYYPLENKEVGNKLVFYTRAFTPRRMFQLGIMALNEVHKENPDIHITLVGEDLSAYNIQFPYENLGVVSTEELAKVLRESDLCLCMSATNLSLLPLEAMASGSVVVSNDGPNAWIINKDNAVIVENDFYDIAEKIINIFSYPEKIKQLRKAGIKYASQTSWENAGKSVASAFKEIYELTT